MNGSITYAIMIIICLQYEPELFPGLIYRMKVPKIVLLIFVSGKVVLTGKLSGPDAFGMLLDAILQKQNPRWLHDTLLLL